MDHRAIDLLARTPAPSTRVLVADSGLDRIAIAVWRVAVVCALALLLGPWGGRTEWVRPNGSSIRDAAGYDWIALLAGLAALLALVVGRLYRPAVVGAVASSIMALVAFAASAYVSASYALAIEQGNLLIGGAFVAPARYAVFPAAGPPLFTGIAAVGAIAALATTVLWFRPGRDG
jgi:hypothetical protein